MVHNLEEPLVAFVLVISSVVLLTVLDGLFEACHFFVVRILDVFLKLLAVFVSRLRNFSRRLLAILLIVFSLLLSAVSEAFRWLSWKLFVVFVGRLGSFSLFLLAVLEASHCFRRQSWKLQFAVLAVL